MSPLEVSCGALRERAKAAIDAECGPICVEKLLRFRDRTSDRAVSYGWLTLDHETRRAAPDGHRTRNAWHHSGAVHALSFVSVGGFTLHVSLAFGAHPLDRSFTF
jgi:hypothetical protein